MASTGSSVGSGISLSNGSAVLATAGTYEVSYTFSGDATNLGTLVSAYLTLNGAEVTGSRTLTSTGSLVTEDAFVSLTMLVTTTSANSVLTLVNAAPSANTSTLGNGIVASLSVTRLTP